MLCIREVNEENYEEVIKLELKVDQKEVICTNLESLAEAYIYKDIAKAFAIYNDTIVVGFLLMQVDIKDKYFDIWRIMIGKEFQGKGYGEQALRLAINFQIQNGAKVIHLSHQTNNYGPSKLYKKVGFKYTGEIEDGEVLMEYQVAKNIL